MANKITLQAHQLVVEPQGLDKIWSLRKHLVVPYQHILGATVNREISRASRGWRVLGTSIPGYYYAGTFKNQGMLNFYNIKAGRTVIVIKLQHEKYHSLVLEVKNPQALVAQINQKIKQ